MKLLYTIAFSFISIISHGQFYVKTGYAAGLPQDKMAKNISLVHSLALSGYYRLPGPLSRIWVGADMGYGVYAHTSKVQTFTFDNGETTRTRVNYTSSAVQAALAGKVLLLENKAVMPYVSGKAGYTGFYSNIYIEDPQDAGNCHPLDHRNIIRDGVLSFGYGGGVMADWSLFSKNARKGRNWIDLSVTRISGGDMDYINTKKLVDPSNPPVGGDGKPLNVPFINASTNQIHEHQVAQVYTTPLRLLELRLSAVFAL